MRWPRFVFYISVLLAFVVHAGVFFLLYSKVEPTKPLTQKATPTPAIQAQAFDESAIAQEVQRIAKEERQEKLKRENEKKAAREAVQKAKALALAENKRLLEAKKRKEQLLKKTQHLEAEAKLKIKKLKDNLHNLSKKQLAEQAAVDKLNHRKKKLAEKIKLEKTRVAKMKEESLLQKQLQAEQAVDNARDQHIKNEIAKYTGMIRDKVTHNLLWQGDKNLSCLLKVRVAPTGTVLNVIISQKSANKAYCHAAERAVFKSSPLPVPEEPEVFHAFSKFILTVKAQELIS